MSRIAFVAPVLAWTLLFTMFPLFYSLPRSFQERYRTAESREQQSRWVGLDNYRHAIEDRAICQSVAFTLSIVGLAVGAELALGTALALAVFHVSGGQRGGWIKAIFASPMLAAPVAIAYLSLSFFDQQAGLFNLMLGLGVSAESLPNWRATAPWSLIAIVLIDCWQWTPFCFLILSAALGSVPAETLEAAAVEGACCWTATKSILLPLIRPTIVVVLLLRLIEAFKIFDAPYVLTGGGPGTSTYTYTQWVWRIGLREGNHELASALGYLFLIPVIVVATLWIRRARRAEE